MLGTDATLLCADKQRLKKYTALLLVLVFLLCGCDVGGKQFYFSVRNPFTVFSIGNMSCGTKEAKIYIANYRNIYGRVGSTDLLSEGFDSVEIKEGLTRSAIYHLSRVYLLNVYAKERETELSSAEEESVASAAEEYFTSLDEKERTDAKLELSDIKKMYEHYAIAKKVYKELMQSVDEDVSEEESRIMDALVLFVRNEKTYQKIKTQLDDDHDFERLHSMYTEGEKGIESFGRGTFPKKVESIAFSLENGEISDGIKTDSGYYFIKCVDKYNKTLSEENKNSILSSRKEKVIGGIIKEQSEKYYSYINLPLINKIQEEMDDSLKTDLFFTIIEEHL